MLADERAGTVPPGAPGKTDDRFVLTQHQFEGKKIGAEACHHASLDENTVRICNLRHGN
ncbi:hypothetical protein BN2497_1783 [Janthinobacterium sp. CG23_2]|nr:hypothetical protein BN2497_1783 [Janthinobacterium sp. CG23_2]CUU27289.1 hypothetical protein BN3177_1783 [Janthinobacterium sp. CG23_2]